MTDKPKLPALTDSALKKLISAYKDLVSDIHIQHGHSGFSDECRRPECAYYTRIVKSYEHTRDWGKSQP